MFKKALLLLTFITLSVSCSHTKDFRISERYSKEEIKSLKSCHKYTEWYFSRLESKGYEYHDSLFNYQGITFFFGRADGKRKRILIFWRSSLINNPPKEIRNLKYLRSCIQERTDEIFHVYSSFYTARDIEDIRESDTGHDETY